MANIEISNKFISVNNMSGADILSYVKEKLEKTCKIKSIFQAGDRLAVEGSVSESVFTNVTKFNATITVKSQDGNVRLMAEGKSTCNWVFVVFIVIGLFTGVLMVVGFVLYIMQRNKPAETLKSIFDATETEYGKI